MYLSVHFRWQLSFLTTIQYYLISYIILHLCGLFEVLWNHCCLQKNKDFRLINSIFFLCPFPSFSTKVWTLFLKTIWNLCHPLPVAVWQWEMNNPLTPPGGNTGSVLTEIYAPDARKEQWAARSLKRCLCFSGRRLVHDPSCLRARAVIERLWGTVSSITSSKCLF